MLIDAHFGCEQKTGGDQDGTVAVPEGWVAIPGAVIVREKHEKKSNTRDEINERLETEEVQHLGHISHQVRIPIHNDIHSLFFEPHWRIGRYFSISSIPEFVICG